ncbi:MAG: hypothetical protein ACI4SQ_04565 [Eubacterium sp.]
MKKHRVRYGFALSVIVLVLITVILCVRSYDLGGYEGAFHQSKVTVLNRVWTKTPDVSDSSNNDFYLVYSYTTSNEEPHHQVLAIESYWSVMEVFVGEKCVFKCHDNYNRGLTVRWVELPNDISGKTIRIRTLNDEKALDQKLIGTCCLGQKDAILFRMILQNMYVVVFVLVTFLASVILLFTTFVFRKKVPDKFIASFVNLGLFILSAGVWLAVDSRLLQFFTGHSSVISLITYLSIYLMPVFCLMFIKEMLSKYYPVLSYLAFGHEGMLVLSMFIYIFAEIPMYRFVYVEHVLVLISIVFVIKYMIEELQIYQKKLMGTMVKGILLLFVFVLIAIIDFHFDHDSSYAIWFGIGMLIFIAFMWRVGMKSLMYWYDRDRRVEDYKKADHYDPLSGMENERSFQAFRNDENLPAELTYIRFKIINNLEYSEKDMWKRDQIILDLTECIRTIFEQRGKCYRLADKDFIVVLKYMKSNEVKERLQNVEAVIQNRNRHRKEPIQIRYAYAQMPQECDEEIELYDLVEERVQIQ